MMFATRDHRAFLTVSLILSVIVHLVLLFLVRVEIGMEDRDLWSSIIDMRKIFRLPSGHIVDSRERMTALKIREEAEESEEAVQEIEETERPAERSPDEAEVTEIPGSEPGPVRFFDPDSLDLLLAFPWIVPLGEEPPGPRRMTGLERALRRLWMEEIERRESEGLTVDSKYGEFGISPQGIHLGPIVIPVPLAPYTTAEKRAEVQAHSEIEAQTLDRSLRDDDLQEQRERILEWKRRREGGE